MKNKKVKLLSIGHYLPEKILTNFDLEKMVDTSDEWITQRTGIKERRIAREDETSATMGSLAAQNALKNAKMKAEDLDIIICATITPDYQTTACLIQKALGAKNAFAFDISCACSGFIYGLEIAQKFILADNSKKILVIATEKLSSVTDWNDRSTCVLFGDGAGAGILTISDDDSGIQKSFIKSDGDKFDLLMIQDRGYLTMAGNDVFKNAVTDMCEAAVSVVEASNWDRKDIKLLVPHQANIRIIESVKKKLKLTDDQVYINLHKIGNTSASTIPIALSEAVLEGKINRGDKIVLASFGAGFTWAGMTIIW